MLSGPQASVCYPFSLLLSQLPAISRVLVVISVTAFLFLLCKFLSLTEEDLNKFESLTMGAKKKLKTQLELEK